MAARTTDADVEPTANAAAAASFLTPEQAVEMQRLDTSQQLQSPSHHPHPAAADLASPSALQERPYSAARVAASFPASVDESELDCEAQELGPEVVVHSNYPPERSRAEFVSPAQPAAAAAAAAASSSSAVPSARARRCVAPVSISVSRTEFELTELDMLRLRPFIHGVHLRVLKKRARWTWAADSIFRRVWCALRAIGILYHAIMVPLRASFSERSPSFPHTLVLDYVWDAFFLVDFAMWSFFFSTHDYATIGAEVHLVYRARDIARHYRQWHGFLYDVVATAPVDWILIPFGLWHAIVWLRLLKVLRMRNLLTSIQSVHPHFFRNVADPVAQQLVVVFASIYLGQHWAACAWSLLRNGMPDPSNAAEDTSLNALAALYLRALYFIQCTVVTLGPGDIVAETSSEVAFVAAVMLCGFVAQAALVGHLITLLKHRLSRRAWYRASLMKLKQFCLLHDLPSHVTRRLFHYYHFLWARQRGINERQLLATAFPAIYLPDLGIEVAMEMLERLPLFRSAPPPLGFLRALVKSLVPETFVPSTTVLQQGVCNTRLFLIMHGTVEQILDDIDAERNFDGEAAAAAAASTQATADLAATPTVAAETDAAADAAGLVSSFADKPLSSRSTTVHSRSLHSGSYFGHDSFLVPANSLPYTFLSTTYVDLFSIEAAAFREVLAAYPELESKVDQYVSTMYASSDKLKSSQRVLALNSNVSARVRRIKREQHIEQMKRIFARRQKTRKSIGSKRQTRSQLGLASARGMRGVSSTKAAKLTAAAAAAAAAGSSADSVWILKPHSVLHILLQSCSFAAFCYLCVSLPLRFAFARNWVDPSEFVADMLLDYIIDGWFLVEMMLRLTLIAIVDELNPHDPLITETRVIRSTYLRSNAFVLDALSLLPLDFIPLFLSLHETDGAAIHLGFVCLLRMLRVLLRFHRFFHYFQSFVFALTLGFDKSGLIELNAATGGFGGQNSSHDGTAGGMASDAADLLEGDDDLSDDSTDEDDSSDEEGGTSASGGTKTSDPSEDGGKTRRRSLTVSENSAPKRSKCATWLASLNTPHAVLSHSYHTRTALLVLRLLLLVAFFLHLSACLFFFIAKLEGVPGAFIRPDGSSVFAAETAVDAAASSYQSGGKASTFTAAQSVNWAWRHHLWFNEVSASIQYLRSLLWALETATVIGVGTATPITSSEITFAFFFTMFGSALYLGLLGVLTVLVDSALAHSHAFEHSILESDHFIAAQNLPSTLRLRIHSFWHYRHFLQSGLSDLEFLRALPTHLKIDVLSSLTLGILTSIPLLASIELGALEKMLVGLEPLSAGPCDVLLMEGEVSPNLIMIQKGSVDVSMAASAEEEHGGAAAPSAARMTSAAQPARDRSGTVLPVLKGGNYFNERCLLLFSPSAASYVALSFCHLFSLSRRAFDEALVDYPVFRGVIKERRTKLKQMERDRLERMRKKVERKEREQAAREAVASTAGGLPMPPPPPASPPSVPAPAQSSSAEASDAAAASLPTSALSPAEIARAERKRRQHEKADALRDAKAVLPPVHRRSSTENIGTPSDDVSFIPTTAGTDVVISARPPARNRRATQSLSYASGSRLGLFVSVESDSSSDDEETRLHLLELKRRDTLLSRMEAAAEADALPAATPLLLGERSGFRDLELTVTRRFNKNNSVRNFLSNAERDASAEAFEAGSAVKSKEDEAQQRRAAEEAAMQQQILAMTTEHPEMAASTPTAAHGGLDGLHSQSFAPQTVHHLQRTFTRNVLYKSTGAKMFYFAFCCHTNLFSRCFRALPSGSFNSLRGRVFAPTSSFRVSWNLVSLLIMIYYFLAIPFRLCVGFFPEDSALGTRGMDGRGRITHEVPAEITLSGLPLQFEGIIYPFQSQAARDALFIGLWILEALMTLFWMADLVLRCRCFPLFVHHSDGLHSIKKVATAWFPKGKEPIVVQHAQHQSATHLLGRSSTTQVLGGASGATLAHTVLQARKAFLKGSSKPTARPSNNETPHLAIVPDEPAAPLPSAATPAAPASAFDSSTLIFHQYWLSGQVKWDVLGTLPLDLALSLYSPSLGSLVRVLRLARAHRIWNYVQALENFVEFHSVRINPAVLRISEQMFLLVFITHLFGCVWCLVGRFEFERGVASTKYNAPAFSRQLNATVFNPLQVSMQSGFEPTHGWLCEEAFTPLYGHVRTMSNLYLTAVYFVLAAISTTGFGDVQPHTALESGFLILLILTGCVVYSFVTANIASLAANMDISAEAFGDRFDAVKSFSAHRRIPKPQQQKLVAYHRQLWNSSKGYDENQFLDSLPCFLKQATAFTIHEARLQSHPLFAGMEEAFLIRVALSLRHLMCVSRQVILHEGAISLEMHFIARGSVHMVSAAGEGGKGKVVEELEEGGSFNDVALALFPVPSKSAGRRSGHGSKRSSLQTDGKKAGPLMEIKESEEDAAEGDADPAVDTAAPIASMKHPQHPSLDSSIFPPRQLYAVVTASVSADLYLLHRHDLMDLCKLYPVSSAEFKRRWMEKAPQEPETVTEAPAPFDLRQPPLGSPSSAASVAAPSPSDLETHRHRRFRSTFTAPNQSPPTPLSHMGHSQLFSPKASPSAPPSPFTDRRPQLHAMPSLVRPVSLVLPSDPGADALRSNRPAPKESMAASFNFKAWFQGGAFVLRDTRTSRLLWNALGFLFLLLRCCVLPLFIAFTQVHQLDPSDPRARPTRASDESFWVFLSLGFAVDWFFMLDLWLHVRHFAQERSWEGVHWRHYFPAHKLEQQMAAMQEMVREMREMQAKEAAAHILHAAHFHAADCKNLATGSPAAAKPSRKVADLTVMCESVPDARHLTVVTDSSPQAAATTPTRVTPALTRARRAVKSVSLAAYSSLSTLPFRVDPFPSTCAEVQYAYLHQPGAWFRIPVDCIAVCPLTLGALIIMLATGSEINFTLLSLLSLNQLLLLRRLFPYLQCLNAFLDRTERAYLSFQSRRILQFVALIMLLLHWVSCVWLLLGSTNVKPDALRDDLLSGRQTDEHVTWQLLMKDGQVRSLSPGHQYLYALYFSVAVVTTTGFGDITPTRSSEVMFTMLVILVGNVIYGAIIGAVTTATNNRAQAIAAQFTNLRALTAYCKHRHVSETLTAKVLAFHKHRWRTHGSVDDAAVLGGLPPLLRGEVSFSLYGACLRQVPFFPKDDIGFLSALASLLRTQLYVAGDLVFRQGDLGYELLFLRSGRVRVFIYDSLEQGGSLRKKITLQSPIWLGEQAFFVQGLRTASVRALTHCEMLVLSDSDFQSLLAAYPRYRSRIADAVCAPQVDDVHQRKPVANPTFMDFNKVLHHQKQSQSQQQMQHIVEQIRHSSANAAGTNETGPSSQPLAGPSAVLATTSASSSSSAAAAAASAASASSSSPEPKPATPVISFANLVKLLGPSPHTPPAHRAGHGRTNSSGIDGRKDAPPQHPPSLGPRPSIAQRSDTFQRMRES